MREAYFNGDGDLHGNAEQQKYNLKRWLSRTLKRWPWFLLSLIIFISLAWLYLSMAHPVYKSVASLMVKDETKGGDLATDRRLQELGLASDNKLVVNEIEILKSYDLMQNVVDSLKLFASVKRDGRLRDVSVYDDEIPFRLEILNPERIPEHRRWIVQKSNDSLTFKGHKNDIGVLVQSGKTYSQSGIKFKIHHIDRALFSKSSLPDGQYFIDVFPKDAIVIQYSQNLVVEPASKLSSIINLEFKDQNRKKATAVLRSLVHLYNKHGLDKRNDEASNTINFLNDRLTAVAKELKDVENTVEKFKSDNKLTKLSTDAEQYLNTAREVDAQKAETQTQLNIITALERDLRGNQENPQMVPSAYGINDPSLNNLFQKYTELLQQKVKIREKSGPQNPLLIETDIQIKDLRSQLLANVRNLKKAYTISLNDITSKDEALSEMIQNVPQLEKELLQITRSQNVQEQLYTYLLQKREEATVSQASNVQDSQTIVEARDLGEVSPKRKIVWAIGVFAGFLIPLSLFNFQRFMYNKVGDVDDVEQHISSPLIGLISHIKKLKSKIVIDSQSRTVVSEQFRHLRTSITYALKDKPVKIILVTSFQPGDGKSFISLNLAACYALLKKKTVMLEFDLRKPHIANDFNIQATDGISTILAGQARLEDVLVSVEEYDGYLHLLPAGKQTINPAELISGDAILDLMIALSDQFEYIIINSPPIGIVTDANILQKFADISLMVLRQDHTSAVVYKELRTRIIREFQNPVYIVLNDVGKRRIYRDSNGYGSYVYELGKGYYTENS